MIVDLERLNLKDHHTFCDQFGGRYEKILGIAFFEALFRVPVLVADRLKNSAIYCVRTVAALFDT
jgi:hypothetical protein